MLFSITMQKSINFVSIQSITNTKGSYRFYLAAAIPGLGFHQGLCGRQCPCSISFICDLVVTQHITQILVQSTPLILPHCSSTEQSDLREIPICKLGFIKEKYCLESSLQHNLPILNKSNSSNHYCLIPYNVTWKTIISHD